MLRGFFQSAYQRKDPKVAAEATRRLSIAYGFVGWNLFCVVFYMIWKHNVPDDKHERRKLLSKLNPEGVTHVIRGSGLTLRENYAVDPSKVQPTGVNEVGQKNVETL